MTPTREVYWNISRIWLMYVLCIPTLIVFAYGLHRRYRLWRLGKPEARFDSLFLRLKGVCVYGLGQAKLLRRPYAGIFHLLFFSGFVILFLGTVVVLLHEDFGLHLMQGRFYLYFQSLALDVFGLLATLAILMAVLRRCLMKPVGLSNQWQDAVILGSLLLILITGFVIEGLRIVVTRDPWASWSPVGLSAGKFLESLLPPGALAPMHATLWWFHLLLVLALMAWLPYSKLLHLLTSTANIFFRSLEPKGAMLKPVDLQAATYGVNSINQFTWKDLLDLDACTECGRCQDACPASATGKPLSPKALILDLRDHLHTRHPIPRAGEQTTEGHSPPLIGSIVKEESLWSCTTCMACMEECPVMIEQVPKIVDMRRHLVMEQGRLPGSMEQALRNLEARGHPFTGLSSSRLDWCEGLNLKILSQGEQAEYLYWVGCSTSLDGRHQKIARAFARLLQRAGVDFAILGDQECCSGDPARRMGNEVLFELVARRNIEMLQARNFKKLITTCPHCFNTLKNEYPRLGGIFEVVHHSQILAELVSSGTLNGAEKIAAKVTYHDPCYLGRYNEIYDEPRKIIGAVSRSGISEMAQRRERSFCCGAGGGLMWAEESNTKRINDERARQALQTGAQILTVACPFCMTMLEDGLKSHETGQPVKVLDIAELLEYPNDP
jgi:Fe-S oxidoreductase/nitrate reductase gamma subunit